MPVSDLPVENEPGRYRFRVELSGVEFGIRLYFNRRDDHWFADIFDAAGIPIRSGVKLVADFPLLKNWIQQGRPDGEILAIDASSDLDPAREDLGVRTPLVYDDENF